MIARRTIVAAIAAGAIAPAAFGHTLYPQWVVYRRKHLLIGCHRKDPDTFRLAQDLAERINHAMPKAKARAARAPHPQRLASLIGTDQMEIAVLPRAEAREMRDGVGKFVPYGRIDLTRLADFGVHTLVAAGRFPQRHAWMVRAAIEDSGLQQSLPKDVVLPLHPGAEAQMAGVRLDDLPEEQ